MKICMGIFPVQDSPPMICLVVNCGGPSPSGGGPVPFFDFPAVAAFGSGFPFDAAVVALGSGLPFDDVVVAFEF